MLWMLGIAIASATPNGYTRVTEKVLGAGQEGFAVMRFEEINHGSYYDWEEKTYLDEFKKGGKGRELMKSTLLTHMKFSYPDANPILPVTRKVIAQDSTIKLGAVTANYPMNLGLKWTSDEVKELKFVENVGLLLSDFGHLFSAKELEEEFGKVGFTINSVTTVGRGLFIEIASGFPADDDHSDQQIRQLFVPEKMADQIWNHRQKEEVYLMAGEFPDLAKAQTFAADLNEKVKRQKIWSRFEIWTKRKNGTDSYRVVLARSKEALREEDHLKWGEKLGTRLVAISGKSLRRKQALASE